MAETCIVCLGDMGGGDHSLPIALPINGADDDAAFEGGRSPSNAQIDPVPGPEDESTVIAHLLPCGHNLHNECLKPWVERTNSCPICRQSFNMVELCNKLNGPAISSYPVNDKIQVAEIDPLMYIDEIDEPEAQPCPICGSDENEEVLLLCDGCDAAYHTFCVDLDEVPHGEWFCESCSITRAIDPIGDHRVARSRSSSGRTVERIRERTRGQRRRQRNRDQSNSSTWARVWQSVFHSLGVDLDFPFSDEETTATGRRPREWRRRLEVARRQGNDHFGEAVSSILESRRRPSSPEPESLEEVMAWNALEKARDIEADPAPKTRKRKSVTKSPSETDGNVRKRRRRSATSSPSEPIAAPVPARRLKRPRTRRAFEVSDIDPEAVVAESSTSSRQKSGPSATHTNGTPSDINGEVPTFLQSLLDEVESSAVAEEGQAQHRPANLTVNTSAADHPSPHHSSPAVSPTASNHPSPRALSITPPPFSARPGSPAPLTSKIEPIYPPAPDFRREPSPPIETSTSPKPLAAHRSSKSQSSRISRWVQHTNHQLSSSPPPVPPPEKSESRPRSAAGGEEATSPTRTANHNNSNHIPLSTKESVHRLVKDALRPRWEKGELSKEQYTDVNRSICRMLYDRIGNEDNLGGSGGPVLNGDMTAESWRKIAAEEVASALEGLQGSVVAAAALSPVVAAPSPS